MRGLNKVDDWEYLLKATIEEEQVLEAHSENLKQTVVSKVYKPYHEQGSDGGTVSRVVLAPDVEKLISTLPADGKARAGHGHRLAAHIENGGKISTKDARALAMGLDPNTNEAIMPERVAYFRKRAKMTAKQLEAEAKNKKKESHIAAWEETQDTAKDPNLFWTDAVIKGDFEWAENYDKAMQLASSKTMQFGHDVLGVYQTRRSFTDENGDRQRCYEKALDFIAVDFHHHTSRPTGNGESKGSPQNHIHKLIANMVLCKDGQWRALDSSALHYHRATLDAYFKVVFYDELRKLPGMEHMEIEMNGPIERIKGVPEKMVKDFSPRRREIVAAADAKGLSTADRRAMQILAKQTRGDKDEQPPIHKLVDEWKPLMEKHLGDKSIFDVMAKREVIVETAEEKMERVALKALETIGANNTVVDDRHVIISTLRACVGEYGPEEAQKVINHVKIKHLTLFKVDDQQRLQFAVKHLVEKEHNFMRLIENAPEIRPLVETREEAEGWVKWVKETYPKQFHFLNKEQDEAIVQFLITGDIAKALVGPAGTGKTTLMQAFRIIAEDQLGYEIWAASPSWKAATGIGVEMGLHKDRYMAIAKMTAGINHGKIKFHAKSILVIDEAGMTPMEDAEILLKAIAAARTDDNRDGARMQMVGDPHQLAPVASGTPMSILMSMKGAHKLTEIQRQRDDRTAETRELTHQLRTAVSLFVTAGDKVTKTDPMTRPDADAPKVIEDADTDEDGKKISSKINKTVLKAVRILDEIGRIEICENREKTIHAYADDYVAKYLKAREEAIQEGTPHKGDGREVIFSTKMNVDVHDSNDEIDNLMLEKEILKGPIVEYDTYVRNNRDSEISVKFRAFPGKRICFGGRQNNIDDPYNQNPEALMLVGQEKLDGLTINNSDFGTIRDVIPRENEEPLIGFELDKHPGHVFYLTPSELAVIDPFVDRKPLPVMQAGWVGTTHSLQGVSVWYSSHLDTNGSEFRQIYVGMSRMKRDGTMFVSQERFELNKLEREGIVIVEENGKVTIPHSDEKKTLDAEDFQLQREDIIMSIAYEASLTEGKSNYSDHEYYKSKEGKKAFVEAERPWELHEKRLIAEKKEELENLDRRIINEKARLTGEIGKTSGIYIDPVKPKPEHILKGEINPFEHVKPIEQPSMEALKNQKEKIMARNYESKLISDAEKAKFWDTNPYDVLRHFGYVDIPNSDGSKKTAYELCERVENKKAHGRIYVYKSPHGWTIGNFKSGDKAVRLDTWMVENGEASSIPQAWHRLRDLMSTEHLKDNAYKIEPKKIEPPKPLDIRLKEEWAMQTQKSKLPSFPETPSAKDKLNRILAKEKPNTIPWKQATQLKEVIEKGERPNAKPAEKELAAKVAHNIEAEKGFFVSKIEMMRHLQPADMSFLMKRGIHPAVVEAVNRQMPLRSAPIKCQKTDRYVGGVAAFQMGPEGPIGYNIKRDLAFKKEDDGYKPFDSGMYSPGGGRAVGVFGYSLDNGDAKTIIPVEGTLDLLAQVQMMVGHDLPHPNIKMSPETMKAWADKIENRMIEEKITILSTDGNPSSTALVCFEDIATRNKGATWPNGNDFDPAGREFRKSIETAVLAGDPTAKFTEISKDYYKDLNDKLLNKPLSVEAVMKTVNSVRNQPEPKRYNKPRFAYEVYSEANVLKKMEAYNRDHPNSKVNLDAYKGVGFTEAEIKQFRATIAELKAEQAKVENQKPIEIAKTVQSFSRPSGLPRPQIDTQKPAEIRLPTEPKPIQQQPVQAEKPAQMAKPTVQPAMRNGFTRPAVTMKQADEAARVRAQKEAAEARAREAATRKAQEDERSKGYRM